MENSHHLLHLHAHAPFGAAMRRGVWSAEEHDRFLQALKRFPDGPWQQLALCVGTRSTRQVQTHAQKFFEKIRRRQRGLRRSYVHSGMAREHRVDEDVVAMLSSPPPQSDSTHDDDDDGEDGDEDPDADDDGDSGDEADSSDGEEKAGDNGHRRERKASADAETTTGKSGTPKARQTGKRRRPTVPVATATSAATAEVRTLPRRIRIRRSARNALQIAASRDQLMMQAMGVDVMLPSTPTDAAAVSPVDATMLLFGKAAPDVKLPSIEEALDFFLEAIDVDSVGALSSSSSWSAAK